MQLSQSFPEVKHHLIKLAFGADLHESVCNYCRDNNIEMAWLTALGALSKVELAFYNQKTFQYQTQTYMGEYEILNATGNVCLKSGQPFAHIHMTLSGDDFVAFGGHVMPSKTQVFACEVHLVELTGPIGFHRDQKDPYTGLYLWETCPID